ncbi:MAG: PEP/pyruvate-binding domain-containing protein [Huintestinicola sp.]
MYIYKLSTLPENGLHFGGKACSLDMLLKNKLPVPGGYAIAAEAFSDGELCIEAKHELDTLISSLSSSCTYAVRSSAVGEDGDESSFAGAYETITNVQLSDLKSAVNKVAASASSERVSVYAGSRNEQWGRIAVVIQQFIFPEYAGVLFTSDPISASSEYMKGNYVRGEGERLVSGEGSDGGFSINAVKYACTGSDEIKPYGKKLFICAKKILSLTGRPQDIEWAVSTGKVYILQARPITTIFRNNKDGFDINDSLCQELLLSKTNVGEIFLRPVSPVTYGFVSKITETIGFSLISNVYGQLYANISGVCSLLVSFGMTKEKAYRTVKEIAGGIPENTEIPIFPFDRKKFIRDLLELMKGSASKKKHRIDLGKNIADRMTELSNEIIDEIRRCDTKDMLNSIWDEKCEPFMKESLKAIMTGLSLTSLFTTKEKLEKICGPELADRLLTDCSEDCNIESLGPLLAIDDVLNGKMSREEYTERYGHRHANEMELALPYPYENPDFPYNVIRDYQAAGINAYAMKSDQMKRHTDAVNEFKKLYPSKSARLDKLLSSYSKAVYGREKIRSDALRLFCMIREYLLKAGKLTGLDDDIFMLYIEEIKALLSGDDSCKSMIPARKAKYNEQLAMPNFPSIIYGRFIPEEWQQSGGGSGFYRFGEHTDTSGDVIAGVAGSCGIAEGTARVLASIDEADSLQKGEILVVPAANIGWVKVFPKAAAIVTDIGAPLSHAVIVARELGIPAAVSCQYASGAIKTGWRIRVDGTSGTVTILERT